MLLKSLYIKNFRQFKGETLIEFAHEKEKNVTIILGDNTYGKTTLLQAFNWCLYNFVVFDKDSNPDMLLNYEIESQMRYGSRETVEVRIVLVHKNVEYTISRTQEYFWMEHKVRGEVPKATMSYKTLGSDGQTDIRTQYIDKVINEILPRDLSNFFFFDTERVRDVSNRKDLSESVKGLLGLTALENAIKHLGSKTLKTTVLGKFYSSMDNEGDRKASEALERINSAQHRKSVIAEQIEEITSHIAYYENEKSRLEHILLEGENTAALQNKSLELEKKIKNETNTLEQIYEKFVQDFNNGAVIFFAKPLMLRAINFLKEAEVDDKGIKDMTAQSIADIIKRGKCICGHELIEGSVEYKNILKQLEYLPPQSIGTSIRNFKEKIIMYDQANQNYYDNLKSRYEDILRSKTRIQEWQDELDNINDDIKDKEDMNKYVNKLTDVKKQLKNLNEKKERYIREDEGCNNDIERNQKIYDSLVAVSSKNKALMIYIRYAEEIKAWMEKTYKEKEIDIRERLEDKVNKIFNKIYHGNRRVSIDEKYNVTLLTTIGEKEIASGESEGLNRVKNFAFITGLVELAKEKIVAIADENKLDLSSEPYPLVMDAPFSNADARHTTNISRVIPEVAEQVIMFVMEKDWHYAEPVMSYRVGSKWILDKKTEYYTVLKRSES
ncbi:MAG: AAA family ATPase [Clostridiaceae bacterium]|nr:AAA family ATPase [Clostridiaceae bacterium]